MTVNIGVDLGGTNLRVAEVDNTGEILQMLSEPTEVEKGYSYTLNKMINMINMIKGGRPLSGIGIGAPGPLDSQKGVILSPPNLPGWDDVRIVRFIQEHFQVNTFLTNDANAAALAEARAGSGEGYESVFYLTVSTGIGGGFVFKEKIFEGAQGYAGEVGNMIINPAGYRHSSLNRGAWEGHASGTAIGRVGKERLQVHDASEVFRLADAENQEALSIIEETVSSLAIGIANITHIINPEIFVIGGGVMKSEKMILEPLKEKIKEFVYPGLREKINIRPAALGGLAGVIGASFLVNE
ncbi:ROK family protein [Jeotgalibacillus proteolyticus]|uniref:ROK family protein n=1 Tax=Jeotgalibacillus proteolyticus TaxID=2082395 RepID=A0A2S5G895_9BACL|nr:ROK family protein [Jeotgalibacillus proteolyticus]PPA69141.1 ROK family protein [Jeotgalibacillus proteolyticus]